MQPLTEQFIRSSFVNASRKETGELVLPQGFDELTEADWARLDYFGWNDPKYARRAYIIVPRSDGDPVGIALRHNGGAPRSRAMCNWCRDVRLPNDVVLWSAKQVGDAGRRGGTVGTLVCQDFECSRNVRNDPPAPYDGYDVAEARARRIDELVRRATGFAEMLVAGR